MNHLLAGTLRHISDERGAAVIRNLKKGEVIISEGDPVNKLRIIFDGKVQMWRKPSTRADAKWHMFETDTHNNRYTVIGVRYYLKRDCRSHRRYRCETDVMLAEIDSRLLITWLNNDKEAALIFVRTLFQNSDGQKALRPLIEKLHDQMMIPGFDPDDLNRVLAFEIDEYREHYEAFASEVIYRIQKIRNLGRKDATVVEIPITNSNRVAPVEASPRRRARGNTVPPPHPGSPRRSAWETSRS